MSTTKVRELLSGPERWVQGKTAVNADGVSVGPSDPSAEKWCLLGAIYYCYPIARAKAIETKLRDRLFSGRKRRLGDCLSVWNDSPSRSFDDVAKLVKDI